jgi:hypothetical protein
MAHARAYPPPLDAPEECWHVYYCDVRVGTMAIRTGMPSRCEPCFSGASTGSEKSEILAGTSAAEGAEVSTKKVWSQGVYRADPAKFGRQPRRFMYSRAR